jgi:hypothetical protein
LLEVGYIFGDFGADLKKPVDDCGAGLSGLAHLVGDEVIEPDERIEVGGEWLITGGRLIGGQRLVVRRQGFGVLRLETGAVAVDAEDASEGGGSLDLRMKLGAVSGDDLGGFIFGGFDLAGGDDDVFELMIDAFLFSQVEAEVSGVIEEIAEIGSHKGGEGTDDLIGGDSGFGDAGTDMALDFGAAQYLIG